MEKEHEEQETNQPFEFRFEKQHYTLSEIARILKRPRTTLKEWGDLFQEFLPAIGEGRTKRYKKEAIEIFKLIERMKEHNEPNEAIREQLATIVKEIVIKTEEPAQQPFIADVLDGIQMIAAKYQELAERYYDLSDELEELKDYVKNLGSEANNHFELINQSIKEEKEKLQGENEKLKEQVVKLTEMQLDSQKILAKVGEQIDQVEKQNREWQTITQQQIEEWKKRSQKKSFFQRLFQK